MRYKSDCEKNTTKHNTSNNKEALAGVDCRTSSDLITHFSDMYVGLLTCWRVKQIEHTNTINAFTNSSYQFHNISWAV